MVDQAAPRKAETVVVLREGTAGPEALLLRRHSRSGFAADAWVFPGGVVDVADRALGSVRWRGVTQRHWRGASGSRPRSCSACTWALGELAYWSRWITPTAERRRYDTCFFLARAPAGQVADHDRIETTGQRWVAPADALELADAGRLHLIYPTIRNLEELAGHGSIDESFAVANAREQVRVIMPHIQVAPDGSRRTIHPDDPDYPGGSDGREPQRA